MAKIITTSHLQQHIGRLLDDVSQSWVIVTKRGRPMAVILPYFEDNEEAVAAYLQACRRNGNGMSLRKWHGKSAVSGASTPSAWRRRSGRKCR